MALDQLELSLMAFPEYWDSTKKKLNVNLLMLPRGNPLKPLGSGPQFAGTTILVKAQFIAGLGTLPLTTSAITRSVPFSAAPPLGAVALFQGLLSSLPAGTTVTESKLGALPPAQARIKKSLPASYTNAFAFERARNDDFSVGDGYGCALRAQNPGQLQPPQGPPPKIIAWGQILSFVLRQPALARAVGLSYSFPLDMDPALVKDGGWLFFTLDDSNPGNPYVGESPDFTRSYAARIPQLASNADRRIFAATLFPILAAPDARYAAPQLEAEIYDDGFAQVVHCNQPQTIDTASLDPDQIAPGAEGGIQIGWDDEQVTVWLNRQIDTLRNRITPGNNAEPEAPMGVQGYRVDVQQKPGDGKWHSLCQVQGALPFSGATADGSGSTPSDELFVAPAPLRSATATWSGPNSDPAWMPLYFAQWLGTSLVVHDDTVSQISPGNKALPASALGADMSGVPSLRYGKDYQFRVRFVDLAGEGPGAGEDPVHPGLAPNGFCPFRRCIPPKTLEIASFPPPTTPPDPPLPARTITQLDVRRPRIGYPEAIFAGTNPSVFTGASLAALVADAQASGRALSVPDPDVDRFQVVIEARIPHHDTGTAGTLPGELDGPQYRVIYSVIEHFPDADPDPAVTLSLDYQDVDDIATLVAPADDSPTLTIPTARDIRIRLIPICTDRSNYYGTAEPPAGLPTDYIVRQEAADETDLYPFDPPTQLKGIYFQPGDNLPLLLAQALGLKADGLTLSAPSGSRTVFGAAGGLRHTLSPDGSTITLANTAELLDHWLIVFVLDIARDWTWDGFAEPALNFYRDAGLAPVGSVSFPRTVAASAVGSIGHPADRSHSRVIFFDTISPHPNPDGFPDTLNPAYSVVAVFKAAPNVQHAYTTLTLPIAVRPHQTPKIVSTGIAESEFQHNEDYSETSLRDRYLWIEFDQPLEDAEDRYFGRVLGYGPDPLLAADLLPPHDVPTTDEPDLPIDPEPVRTIFAGQSEDLSGLDAMEPLIPAVSSGGNPDGVHFLLPLPPGISPEALELFGFWTYEFRVGHHDKWSTAQGRFGRPLRVTGIQHPVPHLICTAQRNREAIVATAPYATTVLNGVRAYNLLHGDPQTAIWVLLYAQVTQTDGASQRNVLLARKLAHVLPDWQAKAFEKFDLLKSDPLNFPLVGPHAVNREPMGYAVFYEKEIRSYLSLLSLPQGSGLSVLAVEVLPGPRHVRGNLKDERGAIQPVGLPSSSSTQAVATAVEEGQEDPLGAQLGWRRVLRTSPLTKVPPIC